MSRVGGSAAVSGPMTRSEAGWAPLHGPPPGPGDMVGTYRIRRLVGAGGMASVFEAADAQGQPLALKVLNPQRVLPEDVKRFSREFLAVSQMDHENVVKVYETGVHDGYPWIAMELIDGTDLETEIERWRGAEPEDRFGRIERIFRGLCHGLACVHDSGLVHRDLKPSNILLTADGTPKLSDFGVVKGDTIGSTQLTLAGRLVGTVAFMAPELITDEDVDPRADLYGLGAVLYVMCTYRRPIEAGTVAGYLARHLSEVPRPITELEPRAPRQLEDIAKRLLQKDKAFRFPSALAVLQALDRSPGQQAPPLRGRDDVLQGWTRWILELQEGAGAVLSVRGGPGMGRTHLLDVMHDQVHAHSLRHGAASGRRGPLLPQLAKGLEVRDPTDLASMLADRPDDPTVLLVDDLDAAADTEIRDLAELVRQRVAIEARPLLLAYTATEPGPRNRELTALESGEFTGIPALGIRLEPLNSSCSVALVRDRGVAGPAAPALGRRLAAMYGGAPGPMVQQIEALVEEGWLVGEGEELQPTRRVDDFRSADLPVPRAVAERVLAILAEMSAPHRRLVALLALLDRPAGAPLLARAQGDRTTTEYRLDELVRTCLVQRTEDGPTCYALSDPGAGRVVRASLEGVERRELHRVLATALDAEPSRRRRKPEEQLEIAEHFRAAEQIAQAWPRYLEAAKRTAAEGRSSEVIQICRRAEEIQDEALRGADPADALEQRRSLYLLRGEALAARRQWAEAIQALQTTVLAAREQGNREALQRGLGTLGRALYRQQRFSDAERVLRESVAVDGGARDQLAPTTRVLADIALRGGHVEEAETLWSRALDVALQMSDADGEARARRGLASVLAVRGQLDASAEQLSRADDLLNPEGDYRVRAGVLCRLVEVDSARGRLGGALHRCERLVDLARTHGLGDRMALALALMAQVQTALGRSEVALEAAAEAELFARAEGPAAWDARLRLARTRLDLGLPEGIVLPREADLPDNPVVAPKAQYLAISARLVASERPDAARARAQAAIRGQQPRLPLAAAVIALDAAWALLAAGAPRAAREAAMGGLQRCDAPGLQLELHLAVHAAASALGGSLDHARAALRETVALILPCLPSQAIDPFKQREAVRRALR